VSRIILVRHGRAAAGWDADLDPGLDDLGREQAIAAADALHPLGPLPVYSSPLRRCRETAEPLAARWGSDITIERGVGEVESPTADLRQRGEWLRVFMAGTWAEQLPELHVWRQRVLGTLIGMEGDDAVVFSHFIAINVAVGAALDDPRVICFTPDNCSRTELRIDGGRFDVVELGGEARTRVN
jgi:broad specificity phosphatase PhoE